MKIAILGTRGIPANYGGFETFAEQLSVRLVARGHDVTVYCRFHHMQYETNRYHGVRLVVLPTITHKYFDTVAHTCLSVFHGLFQDFDVVLVCNSINSLFTVVPRLAGQKVAINVDGLEWQRAKWNRAGRMAYRFGEWLATLLPHRVITDSRNIQMYYDKRFHKPSTFIPYGASVSPPDSEEILGRFNLVPRGYLLYVSRLEPENNAHRVIAAFERVRTDKRLVIVGDAPYSSDYITDLKKTRDPRIVFTGYVFGDGYRALQSNAYLYVQGTEVGGTHPALLEGLGYGNCVIAHDVPEHREVVHDAGLIHDFYDTSGLAGLIERLLKEEEIVAMYRKRAVARIQAEYTWDRITDHYERLFRRMNQE
ncbi:MAG TPA: DUF1972 domain-containing protein [bacterium]|nr:DUF1972 domain-containing protein [bacterium]